MFATSFLPRETDEARASRNLFRSRLLQGLKDGHMKDVDVGRR